MQQAQQQAQQHNPEAAQKSMQQAQQELAQAQQQAQQAQQAMNHEPPDPNAPPSNEPPDPNAPPDPNKPPSNKAPPEMKVEDRNKGTEVGAAKPRQVENTWRAGLPDRERQALLTARKESYAPEMESDVKRYYELLAE
jgi:type II secretory pathway pseudopilin PulG